MAASPQEVIGCWFGISRDARYEIRMYPENLAFLEIHWSAEETPYVASGSWSYRQEGGLLDLALPEGPAEPGIRVSGDPPLFHLNGIGFQPTEPSATGSPGIRIEDSLGRWVLSYPSENDLVVVTLQLHEGGSFTETTRYPDGTDLLAETGSWKLRPDTDLISFAYTLYPEKPYYARLDTDRGALLTPAGEFHRP